MIIFPSPKDSLSFCVFGILQAEEEQKFGIKILRRFSRVFLHKTHTKSFSAFPLHLKCHLNNFQAAVHRKTQINYENPLTWRHFPFSFLQNIIAGASKFFTSDFHPAKVPFLFSSEKVLDWNRFSHYLWCIFQVFHSEKSLVPYMDDVRRRTAD